MSAKDQFNNHRTLSVGKARDATSGDNSPYFPNYSRAGVLDTVGPVLSGQDLGLDPLGIITNPTTTGAAVSGLGLGMQGVILNSPNAEKGGTHRVGTSTQPSRFEKGFGQKRYKQGK
mmetsp:Transcript_16688/g.25733  ORF Transcript_16688/g.25733 Transcript_16688/m.25733 type:complete len:117 (-) Transcript_16688:3380-3730(-)